LRALFIRETRLHEKRLWKKGYEFIFTPFPKKKKKNFSVAAAASDEKLGRVGVGDRKIEHSNQTVIPRLDSGVPTTSHEKIRPRSVCVRLQPQKKKKIFRKRGKNKFVSFLP
jgi:hypothetical protein